MRLKLQPRTGKRPLSRAVVTRCTASKFALPFSSTTTIFTVTSDSQLHVGTTDGAEFQNIIASVTTLLRNGMEYSLAVAGDPIANVIEEQTGLEVSGTSQLGSSGWSSQMMYSTTDGEKFFVKTSRKSSEQMFAGEAKGLQAMYDTGAMRIPKVIGVGDTRGGSFLVTEYLNFGGRADQAALGRALAQMHLATPVEAEGRFGFPIDNTIGGTDQPNGWDSDWVNFFREKRLMHQVNLTGNKKLIDLGKSVADGLESLFEGVTVTPSVLHGDLWSGNMASVKGEPAIFDPATYYGHSEAEFGMSWCAGFSDVFYRAYFEVNPKAKGFEKRRDLYLVYHYLNHYNLFGYGYMAESERLLQKLQRAVQK